MNMIFVSGKKDAIKAEHKDRRFFIMGELSKYEQCQYHLTYHDAKGNVRPNEAWCGCGNRTEETCSRDDLCEFLTILESPL